MEELKHVHIPETPVPTGRCIITVKDFNTLLATLNEHCDTINRLIKSVSMLAEAAELESKENTAEHSELKNSLIDVRASVQALATAISIVQGD